MKGNKNHVEDGIEKSAAYEEIKQSGIRLSKIARKMGLTRSGLLYHLAGEGFVNQEIYNKVKRAIQELNNEPYRPSKNEAELAEGHFYPIIINYEQTFGTMDMNKANVTGRAFFQYPHNGECFCVVFHGDHMESSEGMSISDNDILLVDPLQMVLSGDIALVKVKGDRVLIRQYIESDKTNVILRCRNKKYPDIHIRKEDILKIARICRKQRVETL